MHLCTNRVKPKPPQPPRVNSAPQKPHTTLPMAAKPCLDYLEDGVSQIRKNIYELTEETISSVSAEPFSLPSQTDREKTLTI
jgi:hypothetical protein